MSKQVNMVSKKKSLKVICYTIFSFFVLALMLLNISWKANHHVYSHSTDIKTATIDSSSNKLQAEDLVTNYIHNIYNQAGLSSAGLSEDVFKKAVIGFYNLKNNLNQNKQILTVVDFCKESTTKRMWIIDLENQKLLLNTYVAHGEGSGLNNAYKFSNVEESHQSSLGFYIANETYLGKHGLSLKLDGQDLGVNDKARERAIVVHGADYVSEQFIRKTGRLGRSFGCPAVPQALNKKIIDLIKDGTCLFINGYSKSYQSSLLDDHSLISNLSL